MATGTEESPAAPKAGANGGNKLVIVESPRKARTIAGFLGKGYVKHSEIEVAGLQRAPCFLNRIEGACLWVNRIDCAPHPKSPVLPNNRHSLPAFDTDWAGFGGEAL